MKFPGEELLCKMWQSLAEGGIGSLASPWQIRREGKAHLDVRRQELLVLAQTEADIEAIKKGTKQMLPDGSLINFDESPEEAFSTNNLVEIRREPTLSLSALSETSQAKRLLRETKEEINTNKILINAEKELMGNDAKPKCEIEQDWLSRWHDAAKRVSSEELQLLWAKALAGEVSAPGAYSLRTLDFLKNLSIQEAKQISKMAPFVINDSLHKTSLLESNGIDFGFLLEMEDLGIVSGIKGGGLTLTMRSLTEASYLNYIFNDNKIIIAKHDDTQKKITLDCYKVTSIGKEVLTLGNFQPNTEHFRELALKIKNQEFNVQIADATVATDGSVSYVNAVDV